MNQVYKKDEFVIVQFFKGKRREFIVINTNKADREGFKNAHTHIKSFEMSKYIIKLVKKGKINNGLSVYLLESLRRISEDEVYQEKVKGLIGVKKSKGRKVYRKQPEGLIGRV